MYYKIVLQTVRCVKHSRHLPFSIENRISEEMYQAMSENNDNIRFLSAISYIFVLFIVGHFAVEKDNPDLRFHKFQGGVLFGTFTVLYLIDSIIILCLSFIPPFQMMVAFILTAAISLAYIMLIVMGIRAALSFQQRLLPFIGFFAVRLREMYDNRTK